MSLFHWIVGIVALLLLAYLFLALLNPEKLG